VLDIYVGKEMAQWMIPPLTLQILLENAVKHNTISPEKPLHIVIAEESNHCISISNTLQRRTQSVISTQTGLANLAAKYQLMQQPTPEIIETPEKYTVQITLIPNPNA
jgi:LytS/YehU family sensor histidine kinase